MPFGNVPKKNPGRYFEQFVKVQLLSLLLVIMYNLIVFQVLEPKQSQSSSSSTCFGSPAVGYCNSNSGQGTVGRNG